MVAGVDQWLSWDVSAAVSGWYGGGANLGILIKQSNEGSSANELQLASASEPATSRRPYLEIAYRPTPVATSNPAGVVFAAKTGPDDDWGIWRADWDGSNARIALWTPYNFAPSLSPDGHLVAFVASVDGYDVLSVLDLRTNTTHELYRSELYQSIGAPRWYPDGSRVLFGVGSEQLRTVESDGSNLRTQPVAVPPDVRLPVSWTHYDISPDGESLVYSADVTQGANLNNRAVIISDNGGTNARRLTDPYQSYPWSVRFSRDGTQIAFADGLGGNHAGRVYTMATDGTSLQQAAGGLTNAGEVDWSPEGSVAVTAGADYLVDPDVSIYGPDAAGLGAHLGAFAGTAGLSFAKAAEDPGARTDNELLAKYSPNLNYDSAENYYADNPAVLAHSYVLTPPEDAHTNSLLGEEGNEIASSWGPFNGTPQLNLAFLTDGPTYGDALPSVDADDSIDAYGNSEDEYVPDAQRMHATPTFGNQIYGRVVRDGGMTWLQYWFFYYADWVPGAAQAGDHEGDWEMVQVGLDSTNRPSVATFAAHKDAEAISCPWPQVHKSWGTGSWAPDVYVAVGTHASYPAPGKWPRPALPDDHANGSHLNRPNMVISHFDGIGVGWTNWPGYWGNSHPSNPAEQESPRGPRYQGGRWSAPATFDANARRCPTPQSESAARESDASAASTRSGITVLPRHPRESRSQRPGTPRDGLRLSVRAVDARHVRIRYKLRTLQPSRRTHLYSLMVTGRSSTPSSQPRTYSYRLRRRQGVVTQDLPLGHGPFSIRAAALDAEGTIVYAATARVRQ